MDTHRTKREGGDNCVSRSHNFNLYWWLKKCNKVWLLMQVRKPDTQLSCKEEASQKRSLILLDLFCSGLRLFEKYTSRLHCTDSCVCVCVTLLFSLLRAELEMRRMVAVYEDDLVCCYSCYLKNTAKWLRLHQLQGAMFVVALFHYLLDLQSSCLVGFVRVQWGCWCGEDSQRWWIWSGEFK